MSLPAVTVVIVSDYGGRNAEDWSYLRATLVALAGQTLAEPFEAILVDSTPGEEMPTDLLDVVPDIRRLRGEHVTELLNEAARLASTEWIALLDGDCAPVPCWLEAGLAAARSTPEAVAVSGRTTYEDRGFTNRALATLSRSFLDPGRAGPTRFISSNNAIVRRAALLAHPLGPPPRAMAARLQAEAIRRGGSLRFEPAMRVTHRFDGWPMERRIRRHVGYRAIRVRQLDPRVPHAWLVRAGPVAIPVVLALRVLESVANCVRAGRHYGLRRHEIPAACALALAVHALEVGGMLSAFAEARAAGS